MKAGGKILLGDLVGPLSRSVLGGLEREARAVAALNHPNICHLYDVGPNYLVMELVEGETLRGPLPLDEALKIADQIALALEAAHEKDIIHRDLKPANIKITPEGVVKVLDFGLARIATAESLDQDNSPTLLEMPTEAGTILGTAERALEVSDTMRIESPGPVKTGVTCPVSHFFCVVSTSYADSLP